MKKIKNALSMAAFAMLLGFAMTGCSKKDSPVEIEKDQLSIAELKESLAFTLRVSTKEVVYQADKKQFLVIDSYVYTLQEANKMHEEALKLKGRK